MNNIFYHYQHPILYCIFLHITNILDFQFYFLPIWIKQDLLFIFHIQPHLNLLKIVKKILCQLYESIKKILIFLFNQIFHFMIYFQLARRSGPSINYIRLFVLFFLLFFFLVVCQVFRPYFKVFFITLKCVFEYFLML